MVLSFLADIIINRFKVVILVFLQWFLHLFVIGLAVPWRFLTWWNPFSFSTLYCHLFSSSFQHWSMVCFTFTEIPEPFQLCFGKFTWSSFSLPGSWICSMSLVVLCFFNLFVLRSMLTSAPRHTRVSSTDLLYFSQTATWSIWFWVRVSCILVDIQSCCDNHIILLLAHSSTKRFPFSDLYVCSPWRPTTPSSPSWWSPPKCNIYDVLGFCQWRFSPAHRRHLLPLPRRRLWEHILAQC